MVAFATVLSEFGWRLGSAPPAPHVIRAASGAAFVAIVVGQAATALACRSGSRLAFSVPLRKNPLVPGALAVTWLVAAGLFYVPGLARLLGHGPPTFRGLIAAVLAFPLVLLADSALKRWGAVSRRK
jgi:hypothetical protein